MCFQKWCPEKDTSPIRMHYLKWNRETSGRSDKSKIKNILLKAICILQKCHFHKRQRKAIEMFHMKEACRDLTTDSIPDLTWICSEGTSFIKNNRANWWNWSMYDKLGKSNIKFKFIQVDNYTVVMQENIPINIHWSV